MSTYTNYLGQVNNQILKNITYASQNIKKTSHTAIITQEH